MPLDSRATDLTRCSRRKAAPRRGWREGDRRRERRCRRPRAGRRAGLTGRPGCSVCAKRHAGTSVRGSPPYFTMSRSIWSGTASLPSSGKRQESSVTGAVGPNRTVSCTKPGKAGKISFVRTLFSLVPCQPSTKNGPASSTQRTPPGLSADPSSVLLVPVWPTTKTLTADLHRQPAPIRGRPNHVRRTGTLARQSQAAMTSRPLRRCRSHQPRVPGRTGWPIWKVSNVRNL